MKRILLISAILASAVSLVTAQSRNAQLNLEVTAATGESLLGQEVSLFHTGFQVSYETLSLDADGRCSVKVYPGEHRLNIDRPGFIPYENDFTVPDGTEATTLKITLEELTRTPFALNAELRHNALTGQDDIMLGWNEEPPVFFDDFESYDPFAISFGDWTGIDGDGIAAAPLAGYYPNRGVRNYAQIFNPMQTEPAWWWDYPVLRPYSGMQYAGFVRTTTGAPNDDWLISPVITPGTDNVLSFLAKAADRYLERFMVYVTEKTDNPAPEDFIRLDTGNYESVDYREWNRKVYDLSSYAGRPVRLAIRYVSDMEHYGAFMLMVDDFYVGPEQIKNGARSTAEKCRAMRSPANPNETFRLYLDGKEKGTTDGYSFFFNDVPPGEHRLGVKACYKKSESDMAEITFYVPSDGYARVGFDVTADSKLNPDGTIISLVDVDGSESLQLTVKDGAAEALSLPLGKYSVNVPEGAYQAWTREIEVKDDMRVDVALTDNIIDPYNITSDLLEDGSYSLRWNQELGFAEGFEECEDFATESFGGWTSEDRDKMPVYPIALGSQDNVVSFPGSGTPANPQPLAPIVFNPWNTVPAMLPSDPAIAAYDGNKSIAFFSAQQATNDKWLISPEIGIYEGFSLTFHAKAYAAQYPENLEVYWAEADKPEDMNPLGTVENVVSSAWGEYTVPLDELAGHKVKFGFRYVSRDAFLLQLDDVRVAPADGRGAQVDYGNIINFEIMLDGEKIATVEKPEFILPAPSPGKHTLGITALYKSGRSKTVEYTLEGLSGINCIDADDDFIWFDIQGRRVNPDNLLPGVYLKKSEGKTSKIMIK